MAQTSKKKTAERRLRRKHSLQTRIQNFELKDRVRALESALQQARTDAFYSKVALLTVLAHHGDRIEITRGTYEQVAEEVQHATMTWRIEDKPDEPGTLVLMRTAVEKPTTATASNRVEITKVEDETASTDVHSDSLVVAQ